MTDTLTEADVQYLLMLSPAKRIEILLEAARQAAVLLDRRSRSAESCEPCHVEGIILESVRAQMALAEDDCPLQRM